MIVSGDQGTCWRLHMHSVQHPWNQWHKWHHASPCSRSAQYQIETWGWVHQECWWEGNIPLQCKWHPNTKNQLEEGGRSSIAKEETQGVSRHPNCHRIAETRSWIVWVCGKFASSTDQPELWDYWVFSAYWWYHNNIILSNVVCLMIG